MCQGKGTAETFAERRKYPRYPLKLNINYTSSHKADRQSFFSTTISRDLGIGGIALVVTERLETGQLLDIRIGLPKQENAGSGPEYTPALPVEKVVCLTSRVIWRWPDIGRRYVVGVQFLDLEQEDARALKQFLEEYKLQNSNINNED